MILLMGLIKGKLQSTIEGLSNISFKVSPEGGTKNARKELTLSSLPPSLTMVVAYIIWKSKLISPYQRHKLSWWMVKLTQKINKWKQPQEVEIWENFTSLWLERGSLKLRCKISILQVLQCWKTVLKFHQQMALSFYNKILWS